jgi:hypothetical protein
LRDRRARRHYHDPRRLQRGRIDSGASNSHEIIGRKGVLVKVTDAGLGSSDSTDFHGLMEDRFTSTWSEHHQQLPPTYAGDFDGDQANETIMLRSSASASISVPESSRFTLDRSFCCSTNKYSDGAPDPSTEIPRATLTSTASRQRRSAPEVLYPAPSLCPILLFSFVTNSCLHPIPWGQTR